jgi:type I restriction enzyme S subunit
MTDLKPGWKRVKFGEVVRLNKETCKDPEAAGINRVIGLEHLEPGDLRVRSWGDVADGTTFSNRVRPGQVLFGKRRAYQRKVAVADFDAICSGDIYVFETADQAQLMQELLPYICQTEGFFDYAVGTSAGSLSPRTNWKSLAEYEFALPPVQAQQEVLKALNASWELIEAATGLRKALKALEMSVILNYENGTSPSRMQTLSGIVERIETGRSPKSTGKQAEDGELGVLKVSAVGDWLYHQSENKVISQIDFLPCAEVRTGDLLAARANADPDSVGRTCLVEETRSGLMLSDKTWRIVLKEPVAHYSYAVLAWTKTRIFRKHIRNKLNGTDAKNISQKAFLTAPFPPISQEFTMLDKTVRELEQNQKEACRRESVAAALHSKALTQLLLP